MRDDIQRPYPVQVQGVTGSAYVPIWAVRPEWQHRQWVWGGGRPDLAVPGAVVWGERLIGKQRSLVSSSLRIDVGGVIDQSPLARCCIPKHDPRNMSPVDCA